MVILTLAETDINAVLRLAHASGDTALYSRLVQAVNVGTRKD